jgi:diacylglycerol kinase
MVKVKRLIKSFTYAFRGLKKTFKEEQNLQVQSIFGIITIILGIIYHINRTEWMFIIFCIGLVMLMELANSAVERVADVLQPRIHDYVKEIKDIMAAAVMLSSLVSLIVGLLIFAPYILRSIAN